MRNFKVAIVPVTPFQQNCALVWQEDSGKGVVIDPGGDIALILQKIENKKIEIERILLTHGHIDHVGGATDLAEQLSVPVEGPHIDDQPLLANIETQAQQFGLGSGKNVVPNRWLEEGDNVLISDVQFEVFHCPGHSPGHVVFFNRDAELLIAGDVLFKGSIGRTDLYKGDFDVLIASIKEKLFPLGDQVQFICGHGEPSTIGHERKSNPFLLQM